VTPREKRRLGDALGLTRDRHQPHDIAAGKGIFDAHWHTHEEEFIYVLSGEVVLRTGRPCEQVLTAGMCAEFAAGNCGRPPARSMQRCTGRRLSRGEQSRLAGRMHRISEVDLTLNAADSRDIHAQDGSKLLSARNARQGYSRVDAGATHRLASRAAAARHSVNR
jgi:uncharacterized cupin superfamily protein